VQRKKRELESISDHAFLKDGGQHVLDGLLADTEVVRNLAVGPPRDYSGNDIPFPRRQHHARRRGSHVPFNLQVPPPSFRMVNIKLVRDPLSEQACPSSIKRLVILGVERGDAEAIAAPPPEHDGASNFFRKSL
jgi:hypothetical protein